MFGFKKPVKVKCYSNEELAKLLSWYRLQLGLYGISVTEFEVVVHTRNIFDEFENGAAITCFEVAIPYSKYKVLRDKFIQLEAFDPILEQRPIFDILDRDL